ncbi:MAG: substrate-binding domain-containing protein [Verrucomicrobia bacterium]|jgi:LacI family transcriptional regulator|nr:substrate-binding domain-containing protein [Verrucomicrobiota bacterium]
MKRRHKRVLLALGWYDYRLHLGIERYAQEHDWSLSSNLTRERVIPWGWDGDGILAWLGAGDDLARFVRSAHRPTVDYSLRRPHFRCARVLEDHAHAARLAADHLLSRHVRHFLYYSDTANWAYEERGRGFMAALKQHGCDCLWLRRHRARDFVLGRGEWRRRLRWLASALQQAPKPVGVLAANDQHAIEVLEACELAGLKVPEEVAIVGVGNYLLAADAMQTPISSVDTNLELLGYRGAALLDDLMGGKPVLQTPLRVPARRLVARKSSDLLAINHPGVARALRFIWEHADQPLNVDDVAGAAAMSRRGLHQAFVEQVGRAPGEEIRRVRVDLARRRLTESDDKIEVVALQCGYQSLNSFCVAFKQATGVSPGRYRSEGAGPE